MQQNQTQPLNVKCDLNLDSLPVGFASHLSRQENGTIDRTPLNNAINKLAEIVWKKGGFRFWHRKTNWDNLVYTYFSSQDAERVPPSVAKGQRDTPRMDRYSCQSHLTFSPSFEDRTLTVALRHIYHKPYVDRQLSPAVLEFIQARNAISTPAEIYRDLQAAQPSGWELATSKQVYYQWQQLNSNLWRRDQDPVVSAKILLSEHSDYTSATYFAANLRAIAFYIPDSINTLASNTKELVVDATFGTNNAGMDLFAVLGEVDGTGVPLAYCFVGIYKDNAKGARLAEPGATTAILDQFLRPLQASGFNPTFFGTDKDFSEIEAIRQVWPDVTIQLCFWHARRAIRTKLTSSRQTKTQEEYKPLEAQALIPDLEICWGSMPIRRPDGDHRYGRCTCPSRLVDIIPQGRMETSSGDEQDTVLDIFSRHYNSHPLIPDQNGTYRSTEHIHRACAAEMYYWCRSRNYFRLWAYLWANWYQPSQWALWARSVNEKEIPVLKTTMIIESHWRKIKHDYLHRFNRPRIDLVIWVLLSRSIPDGLTRMQALLQRNHRKATACWRKDFKREWKKRIERSNPLEADHIQRYHTDPVRWTCGCPYFLTSRFLVCKHILSCYEPICDAVDFFRSIQRRRDSPFWTHQQLVLLPRYRPTEAITNIQSDIVSSSETEDDNEEDIDLAAENEDQLVDLEEVEEDIGGFTSDMHIALDLFQEQRAKGNRNFMEKFIAANEASCNYVL